MALPPAPNAPRRRKSTNGTKPEANTPPGATRAARASTEPASIKDLPRRQAFTVEGRRILRDEDEIAAEAAARRTRFPVGSVVGLVVFGLLSFASGWYLAQEGVVPGLFRAADMGVPVTLTLLLRTVTRILSEGINDPSLSRPTSSIPRAGAWALGVFWVLATWTNVLQLAVGLAVGIVLYQTYAAHGRIKRAGYRGLGPGLPLTVTILGAYILWRVLRPFIGPFDVFDPFSFLYTGGLVLWTVLRARRLARAADRAVPDAAVIEEAKKGLSANERRVAMTFGVGYLLFHFLIAPAIPYGPIVEWFLVCVGVLFFAIIAADRIGTVPTRRALPAPEARMHVQKILRIPDRRLEETQAHVQAFVEQGADVDWVRGYFAEILKEAGLSPHDIERHLSPFAAPETRRGVAPVYALGRERREGLVHELLETVRHHRRPRAVPTGTLKTRRPVETPATAHPGPAP